MENSYSDTNDLEYSLNQYKRNRPESWELFFNNLFPYRKTSVHIQRKCDNNFQISFSLAQNGQKKTPMHVSISQSIHKVCRSKELIQIFNRMGLCRSYDEVEKLDSALAQRTISRAGIDHPPVPPSIQSAVLIQGAMDNFYHEEDTKSEIEGSHDTILMLFQNGENNAENNVNRISVKREATNEKKQLNCVLNCQKLIKARKLVRRGQIPGKFILGEPYEAKAIESSSNFDFVTWMMAR